MLSDTAIFQGLRSKSGDLPVPAAVTDIGCEREINEDRYAVIDSSSGKMWVVCDGMGGTLGGELAAQLAIDAMRRVLQDGGSAEPDQALSGAIEEANRRIVLRRQNPSFSGMGTTVVAAILAGDQVVLAHAGDSRAYLVRDGAIQQLTVDHTYVQDLVERGVISEDEAMSHPQAHVLTRCLGAEPRLQLDRQNYWIWENKEGDTSDRLVLCTDGLYSLVNDDEISALISKLEPQQACAELVELAKERGGYDNITVAIIPLDGQLREEAPEKPRTGHIDRRGAAVDDTPTVQISWGTKLFIMFILALIASVGTMLLVMFKISSS